MSSFQDRSVGMYTPYRQADIGQLVAEAEQIALQYASEYDAAERLARWQPEQYDALVG